MFKLQEKQAVPLTLSTLNQCIAQAGDPEALFDQKGRVWSRWQALVPGAFRICAKCERRCLEGYVLQPELTVTICAAHVRRWV